MELDNSNNKEDRARAYYTMEIAILLKQKKHQLSMQADVIDVNSIKKNELEAQFSI